MKLSVRPHACGPSLSKTALLIFTSFPAVLLLLGGAATGNAQPQSGPVQHIRVLHQSRVPHDTESPRAAHLSLRLPAQSNLSPVNTGTGIVYTCDPTINAATCNYLNTTVAGYYNDTFTNANASIYITFGTTDLAQTNFNFNFVTYAQYATAYGNIANKSSVQTSAETSLTNYAFPAYGSDQVWITPALAQALGILGDISGGPTGVLSSNGGACTMPSAGCYNAVITLTNVPGMFYFDNLGGTEGVNEYDFYGTVQHETDEVLGTSSCIGTGPPALTEDCDGITGDTGGPSVTDMFRYSSATNLVLDGNLSTTPGAYFSYNGGTTDVKGVGNSPIYYNTLANGDDYADFVSSTPDCGTNQAIQDAEGCPGEDAGQTILNDGGAEVSILTAIGFGVPGGVPVLSPSTSTVLSGATTFSWTAATGATKYELQVGTHGFGSIDLFGKALYANVLSSPSITIAANGEPVYVQLWYLVGSVWNSTQAVYQESGAAAQPQLSPSTATLLSGPTIFSWTPATGATEYEIQAGTHGYGSTDILLGKAMYPWVTSSSSVNIPASGQKVYVRLWYLVSGVWHSVIATYTEQ